MSDYYTSILILSWLSLLTLCILVWENNRINKKDKKIFYLTYILIAVSALAEWTGLKLCGKANVSAGLLRTVKMFDYILTPMAGGAIIGQIRIRNRWYKFLAGTLCFNAIFQFISLFTGWMVKVDDSHNYSHGPLYFVYVIVYLIIIAIVIIEFIIYGMKFSKHNRKSLYAILILMITGIGIQEVLGGEHRTAYLTLMISATMIFIHYVEYSQLLSDERLKEQQIAITTDALTGVKSRYAYSQTMKKYMNKGQMPEDFAVFLIDINGLKTVNDKLSHEAGDELICGAAECILDTVGSYGETFRIGGDEFVVFTSMVRGEAERAIKELYAATSEWTGKKAKSLSVSAGFALLSEHEGLSLEELTKEADLEMYVAKSNYYRKNGIDKRKM